MSQKKDFYETLGVERNATAQQIKAAYRKAAMRHHPDRNAKKSDAERQESERTFKEMSEAYSVLSDERKRAEYDRFGHTQGGAGAGPFGAGDFGDININDIFEQFFGGGGAAPGPTKGSDLGASIAISLQEAASGVAKEITIKRLCPCTACNGSGAKTGSTPQRCTTCGGHGRVNMQQGFLSIQQTCPTCHGKGTIIKDPCRVCSGSGCTKQSSKISVRIPSGVESGDRMRVPGKGNAGQNGAASGDLYLDIHVQPHPLFERKGVDLHCTVPISFYTACVGGETEVATLEKLIKLKIPKETQSGSALRIRNAGIKSVKHNRHGDLICHIQVETPVKLDTQQIESIKQFDNSITQHNLQNPQSKSFIEKIKSLFA
ncbi:molecular chaperone DnaJ [Candidatus Comchoanobacter bicostacola]|uniref:Chaperone protein DnaJ n=1 Tax=Candidatus Comchoanobacter bicostacola TaxID=2919598 RepID=A0ABY5DL74_9GAMM|nr:molecular chaperone DnaJ [Candidatus Comchoanobacter bicostacola]UTC24692.1 molecular chaperone DnaJ [Candidatus Comchoanobacter bicostacola]